MSIGPARPLVAVLGPTASGKSALAIHLAHLFDGEIVNFDSLQFYRGLDIGTAKPTPAEREGIPHHCLDILDPSEVFSAGAWAAVASPILGDISARRRLPILVGGSGFYLRALLDGLTEGPRRSDALRARLMERHARKPGILHGILRRLDSNSAARIHVNDTNKVIRALEICLLSRQSATELFQRGKVALTGYQCIKLGLDPPRAALRERIAVRCHAMFAAGLVDEVRGLLESGVAANVKPFESIGYRQAIAAVSGQMSVTQATGETIIATSQYAKRQCTWFRKEPALISLSGFGDDDQVRNQAEGVVRTLFQSLQKHSENH